MYHGAYARIEMTPLSLSERKKRYHTVQVSCILRGSPPGERKTENHKSECPQNKNKKGVTLE